MKKRFLGVALVAALAVVGLSSCDESAQLVDENGDTYTVEKTTDSAEVYKVMKSLSNVETDETLEKMQATVELDSDVYEKDSTGTKVAWYDVDLEATAAFAFNDATFTTATYEDVETIYDTFTTQLAKTTAYASIDLDADFKDTETAGTVDVEATLYKNTYTLNNKEVEGLFGSVEEFTVTGDAATSAEKASTIVNLAPDFYVPASLLVTSVFEAYLYNNVLANVQEITPSFKTYIELEGGIDNLTEEDLEHVAITAVSSNSVTFTIAMENSFEVYDYNADGALSFTINTKTGFLTKLSLTANNFESSTTQNTLDGSTLEASVKFKYNDNVKIKSVAKADYVDLSSIAALFA
ncbi:MAG: hypothetical protein K6G48_03100 [Acholeplasmatales bacterium]|nr:hypothetical protein [Acholeplasmatales bacterium]